LLLRDKKVHSKEGINNINMMITVSNGEEQVGFKSPDSLIKQ